MDLSQLLGTVSVEYLGVILYGITAGASAGIATSRLFVQYFQFTGDPSMQMPPFRPFIAYSQILNILIVYFVVLALAEVIVLISATRRNVFQALRMGFRE